MPGVRSPRPELPEFGRIVYGPNERLRLLHVTVTLPNRWRATVLRGA